ncbi:hypothetical protein BH09ACT10_BH09ACT10_12780 [soil metagenome]
MTTRRPRTSGTSQLKRIARLDAKLWRLEAEIAAETLAFIDGRAHEASKGDDERVVALERSFAFDEVGLVLGVGAGSVQNRVARDRRVRDLLPRTWMAWQRGDIDAYRASIIAEHVDKLESQDSIARLDSLVSDYAGTHTPPQLRAWLRRFAARAEPGAQESRRVQKMAERRVSIDHDPDGVAWIHAMVSTADAARADVLLTRLAKQPGSDDPALSSKGAPTPLPTCSWDASTPRAKPR